MKKCIQIFSLCLALLMILPASALAADYGVVEEEPVGNFIEPFDLGISPRAADFPTKEWDFSQGSYSGSIKNLLNGFGTLSLYYFKCGPGEQLTVSGKYRSMYANNTTLAYQLYDTETEKIVESHTFKKQDFSKGVQLSHTFKDLDPSIKYTLRIYNLGTSTYETKPSGTFTVSR